MFYLLGEEFDRDPFLMFKMRGMDRDQLLKKLPQTVSRETVLDTTEIPEETFPPEPLATESATFWQGGELSDEIFGKVEISPVNAALVKRLGNFPYWRGKERFLESIEPIYDRASSQGLNVFLGELD